MTEIYIEISKLSKFFRKICYGISQDSVAINDAVQELMLYFLQMNPETLRKIYENDGTLGIKRYGAVVLKRSLTSLRSPFYYKYRKYYKNLVGQTMSTDSSSYNKIQNEYHKSIYNLPEESEAEEEELKTWEKLEKIDNALDELYWYDKRLFELYYTEKNTLDTLAEKTGISRNSIFTTLQKVKYIIREKVKDE
jgi:RNA polymerase sigma factor (sigma-70 family)|tara:strand:- start:1843 stop:2424 length:582 start_codon:yes stop_codon:yes gene_type:complete